MATKSTTKSKTYEVPNKSGGYTTVNAANKSAAVSSVGSNANLKSSGGSSKSSSADDLLAKGNAMLSQTAAQGSKSFTGSSFDTGSTKAINPNLGADVNTNQPSPTTATIAPPSAQAATPGMGIVDTLNQAGQASDFASRSKLAGTYGMQNYTGTADQNTDLASRYRTGLANANATGAATPDSVGQGSAMVQSNMPQINESAASVNQMLADDPGFQEIEQMRKDYFDPQEQKTSLMDTYKKLYKAEGLDDLDEEIIDAQTVIDGTEDDIRNEIQAAGGMGTDSQIQAMSLSRNKSLLKNYNNLVAMRQMKQNHLDTMVNLADKDRQYAEQKSNAMMNFDMQVIEYKNKFINNARDQYNKQISNFGADGVYEMYKGSPKQLAYAEKIMGLPSGGLAKAATQAATERAKATEMDALELEGKKLSNANIRSQINERNNPIASEGIPTLTGKPQNANQSAANSYANRLTEANVSINNLGNKFTGRFSQLPAFNFMKSSDRQVYEQAQKNFITAVLRRESGASIAPTEFDTAREVYFPVPGDSKEVVKQKSNTRNTVINNFYREANVLRPVFPGDIVEQNGIQYKVDADGETLKEI